MVSKLELPLKDEVGTSEATSDPEVVRNGATRTYSPHLLIEFFENVIRTRRVFLDIEIQDSQLA